MTDYWMIITTITLNIAHSLFYLRLNTRNFWRYLLLFLSISLMWPPSVMLSTKAPFLMPLIMSGYVLFGMIVFKLLVTDDNLSRIFLCCALVLSFTQALRMPSLLFMIYILGWPGEESLRLTAITYPVTFVLLVPLLLLYVRKWVRRILDVAETQKWYLVGLQPVLLIVQGGLTAVLVSSAPENPGVLPLSIITPVCVIANFVSLLLFLVNHRDKLIFRQRLSAAEQLEHTYEFYDSLLSEKESRLRTLRHDFRHLALHLDALVDKGDMEGLRRELRAATRFDAGDVAITPFCENHSVNAIVSYHFAVAEKKGVNCVANAFVPSNLPIPDADLALILGNALENCVKGAGPLGELGYITFNAKPAKSCLVFTFTNNYEKRSYAKGEGAGLASIRQLCERHKAKMETSDTGGEFTLRLYLLLV